MRREDAPEYVATNVYISSDYRMCESYWECFASLFYMHNCFWDSWTAIFAIVHVIALHVAVRLCTGVFEGPAEDAVVFTAFMLVGLLHSPASAAYHIVGCAGKSRADFVLTQRADFLMIHWSSVPLSFALGYYVFYDDPGFLLLSVGGTLLCAVYASATIAREFTPSVRLRQVASLVFFYLLPVFYQTTVDLVAGEPFHPSVLAACGVILALAWGAFTYGTQWPECRWPDLAFGSHSWMHVGVNVAYASEFIFVYVNYVRVMREREL